MSLAPGDSIAADRRGELPPDLGPVGMVLVLDRVDHDRTDRHAEQRLGNRAIDMRGMHRAAKGRSERARGIDDLAVERARALVAMKWIERREDARTAPRGPSFDDQQRD